MANEINNTTCWIPREIAFQHETHGSVSILLPEIDEVTLPNASPKLQENLAAAKKIIKYVNEKVPFSENFPLRSKELRELSKTDPNLFLERCNELIRDNAAWEATNTENTALGYVLRSAQIAEERRLGNCKSLASVGIKYAREQLSVESELYGINPGDHAFLLIGKFPDIAVCCPWSSAAYPGAEMAKRLRDYIDTQDADGTVYTLVRPFDFKTQKISRVPLDDLAYSSRIFKDSIQ